MGQLGYAVCSLAENRHVPQEGVPGAAVSFDITDRAPGDKRDRLLRGIDHLAEEDEITPCHTSMYSGLQRPRKLLLLGVPAEARAEGHHSPKHRGHDYSRDLTDRVLRQAGLKGTGREEAPDG